MDDERRNPIDLGSQCQRSRSDFGTPCLRPSIRLLILGRRFKGQGQFWHYLYIVYNLVGMIQTTVLVLSLSNFICEKRNPIELKSHVQGQGQLWHSACDNLCVHDTDYIFCSITFKLHM